MCSNRSACEVDSGVCPSCHRAPLEVNSATTLDLSILAASDVPARRQSAGFPERLLGRTIGLYSIDALLGKGGMAWVFLGRHNTLHRHCAIKVLCPELLGRKADSLDWFMSEARAAASLVHPHIVAIHSLGEMESHHFIEMEYVPGCSLEQLLHEQSSVSLLDATNFLMQSCSALAAAHRQDFAHRDFKPANILVRQDGTAKLADFGLAKHLAVQTTADSMGLTGTPHFMAPELFRGEHANQRSDIYAVGVSYFYALTKQYPFSHGSIEGLAEAHARQPPPDPRSIRQDIPAEAAALIARCLAKDPRDRFTDAAALLSGMQRVVSCMRDFPDLVRKAISGMEVECQFSTGGVVATMRLANGRSQRVHIEVRPADATEPQLVRIYSVCSPIDEAYFRRALELNAAMPHGALAIQDVDGEPHFVILNSYLQATCEADDIRKSVQEVARWADDIEQGLTEQDVR